MRPILCGLTGSGFRDCYADPVQIVVLTTWFPTTVHPGAGSFIARDAEALAEDAEVEVVHLVAPEHDDGSRRTHHRGIPVTRVPIDVRTPAGALRARAAIQPHLDGADVLHTMAAPSLLPFVLRRPRTPWVHTEHWSGVANLATGGGKFRVVRPIVRRAFAGPDVVVTVSEALAAQVRRVRRHPVTVVGNIVDPMPEPPATRDATDVLRVLGVGAVAPHKGWEIAADAVALLRERGIPAQLTWLGTGPDHGRLADRADVVAPGHVDRERVAAELGRADVFVLPTASETFSLATVEALAAGVPPVVTGVGAHREFLTDGAGVIAERDARSVADGIAAAASQDRATVLARGRELARRYAPEAFRARYQQIYREVLAA